MGKKGAVHSEFSEQTAEGMRRGKMTGPDGRKLFRIYGPHSVRRRCRAPHACDPDLIPHADSVYLRLPRSIWASTTRQ